MSRRGNRPRFRARATRAKRSGGRSHSEIPPAVSPVSYNTHTPSLDTSLFSPSLLSSPLYFSGTDHAVPTVAAFTGHQASGRRLGRYEGETCRC